jgi:hypothetical protein
MDYYSVLPPLFAGILSTILCIIIQQKPKDSINRASLKILLCFFIFQAISNLFTALFFGLGYSVESMGNPLLYFTFTFTYQACYIIILCLSAQLKHSSAIFSEIKTKRIIFIVSLGFIINNVCMLYGAISPYTSFIGVVLELLLAVWSVYLLTKIRQQIKEKIARIKSLILIIGIIFALILTNVFWYIYNPEDLILLRMITIVSNICSMIGMFLIFLSFIWKTTGFTRSA